MKWKDELKKKLIELMFDYYEHGANMHTIIPDNDAKPILADIDSLLKEQMDNVLKQFEGLNLEEPMIDLPLIISLIKSAPPPIGEKK